jgi:adenosine deaminase
VTVNTDDPGLFSSGYLTNTLCGVQSASGYSKSEMTKLMQNAFLGSWVSEEEKNGFLEQLSDYESSAVSN